MTKRKHKNTAQDLKKIIIEYTTWDLFKAPTFTSTLKTEDIQDEKHSCISLVTLKKHDWFWPETSSSVERLRSQSASKMAVVKNYHPNMIGFYCGMASCWSQLAIRPLHKPFSSIENEPKHMTCPSKLLVWGWQPQSTQVLIWGDAALRTIPLFMFFSRKCFVGTSSHRERGQDSDSSVSRVRGGKDVYELLICSTQRSILCRNLPAPHLITVEHYCYGKSWLVMLCHSEPFLPSWCLSCLAHS